MTIVGPDRPGLVDSVASLVTAHGGNWLESRMSRLGGQFAGILRVELPEGAEAAFSQAAEGLRAADLAVLLVADLPAPQSAQGRGWVIQLVGQDRPGIVRQISRALASRQVNVEDLHTECVSAPMSGEPLFKARALVHVPASCNVADLRQELEKIASDLIVDLALQELPEGA
jgi:glycine cleavage system regulatory protein